MRAKAAQQAALCFRQSAAALQEQGVSAHERIIAAWAPGRIEVFGKHADYCGGKSVLAAAKRGFAMIALPNCDRRIQMIDACRGERAEFAIDRDLQPILGHWSNYPQTVARRLALNFPNVVFGATIAFASNFPPSSGMSSSSALVVGTYLQFAKIMELEREEVYQSCIHSREDLAGYVSTIENGMTFESRWRSRSRHVRRQRGPYRHTLLPRR